MLSPKQIEDTSKEMERVCRIIEDKLALQLSELFKFLEEDNLSALDKEAAVKSARMLISEAQAQLRRRTNKVLIKTFKKYGKISANNDVSRLKEDSENAANS